jgi:hypothetical protein
MLTEADITSKLYLAKNILLAGREIRVMFLLPESLWRPLKAKWWKGKEASIIGGDESGNYVLRCSDGSVRLWDHSKRKDEPVASNVRAFLELLQPSSRDGAA